MRVKTSNLVCAILIICCSVFISACSAKVQGVGRKIPLQFDNASIQKEYVDDGIEGREVALIPSYKEAIKIAYEAAGEAFPRARVKIEGFYEHVMIYNVDPWRGDVKARITPQMVENTETNETGFFYNVICEGMGFNASFGPSYVAYDFFDKLADVSDKYKIETTRFKKFKTLQAKAKIDQAPANIPITRAGFKKHIREKPNRSPYEGIWSDDTGTYTLGLISTDKDPRYNFVAFILESKRSIWKPGDIKIKFIDISKNNIAISRFHADNKIDFRLLWKVSPKILVSMNAPDNREFVLVKEFPLPDEKETVAGAGTAWAITENGIFVSSYHVVKNASEIFIGHRDDKPHPARILIADKKSDLVLMQLNDSVKKFKPLPVKTEPEKTGEEVCVIGYPLIPVLSDTPKITGGMVSAQSGVDNDATCYQISAPLQPGNSGAPIINSHGEVVGIAASKLRDEASTDRDVENVNFAVKAAYIEPLIKQIGMEIQKGNSTEVMEPKKVFEEYGGSILPVWSK